MNKFLRKRRSEKVFNTAEQGAANLQNASLAPTWFTLTIVKDKFVEQKRVRDMDRSKLEKLAKL